MENALKERLRTSRQAQLMVRAYNHPERRQILQLLQDNGPMNVGDIYRHPSLADENGQQMEQSICSQHLATLRRARLVHFEQQGKTRTYRADHIFIEALEKTMAIQQKIATGSITVNELAAVERIGQQAVAA